MTQTAQISETKSGRIPGLDGLRAIAIVLIVLGHLWQQDFWYGNCPIPQLPIPGGALSIFFVLCGFCAGYYSSKTADTKTYYKKKAKRLFPAYYTYIAIVILTFLLLGRAEEVLNLRLLYYIVPAGIIPFCHSEGILPLVHLWFLSPIVIAYLLFPALLKAFMGGHEYAHCQHFAFYLPSSNGPYTLQQEKTLSPTDSSALPSSTAFSEACY